MTKSWRWLCSLGIHYWMGCRVTYSDGTEWQEERCRRCMIER